MRRMPLLEKTLVDMGIEEGRFRLEWISGGEAQVYGQVVREFTEHVKQLGPLNWKTNPRK